MQQDVVRCSSMQGVRSGGSKLAPQRAPRRPGGGPGVQDCGSRWWRRTRFADGVVEPVPRPRYRRHHRRCGAGTITLSLGGAERRLRSSPKARGGGAMGAEQQPSVSRSFGYQDPRAGEWGGVDPQTGGRADEALPRDCNCDFMCPGVSPCICLVIYSDETGKHGTCECWCSGGVAEDRRYGLDQIVDFNLRAAPAWQSRLRAGEQMHGGHLHTCAGSRQADDVVVEAGDARNRDSRGRAHGARPRIGNTRHPSTCGPRQPGSRRSRRPAFRRVRLPSRHRTTPIGGPTLSCVLSDGSHGRSR